MMSVQLNARKERWPVAPQLPRRALLKDGFVTETMTVAISATRRSQCVSVWFICRLSLLRTRSQAVAKIADRTAKNSMVHVT